MQKVKKPVYKYCMVPQCKNNNRIAPDKVFFRIPHDVNLRKQWCDVMRRDIVSPLSTLYCCEDHFNVKEDTSNYIEYKIMTEQGEKWRLRLKKGVVPHIFLCQKRSMGPPIERMGVVKRQRLALVNEALSEFDIKNRVLIIGGTPQRSYYEEEYILPDEAPLTVQVAAAILTPVDPIAVPENPIAVPENPIAVPENPIAFPENPIAVPETKTNESLVKEENAQPEHVPVEEIKSTENPIKIEVAPEQVLVQEVLVPASDNGTEKPQSPVAEASGSNDNATDDTLPKDSGDWQQREQELLKKIEQLEEVKIERSEDGLKLELKIREEEIDLLKARVKNLETELQAALSKPGGKNQEMIEKIKQQHEELLSKARGMIFDKTKIVKNQELQIEALTTQIQSLKDINIITKDLLEIRNSEIKAMEERLQVMETRFKGEKERYDLVLKRAQTSSNINDDLRKEYETQLAIFKELREKYEMRVQALVAENNRLKESVQGGASG